MSLLLATDFDGTISDIELDHRDARIAPEILQFLKLTLGREGVAIAIVSGRELEDLRTRTEALPVWYSGSHGLELADPSGLVVRFAEPLREELLRQSGATTPSYAGDDVTDFEALEWAAARGTAFFVKSAERPEVSLARVTVVSNRLELLEHWNRLVASRGA